MDKLRKDLDTLAKLAPKQTLNIKTMTPINHQSFLGATQRLLGRENREKTITTIEQIIDQAILDLPRDIDLIARLKQARIGINNLKETYMDDELIRSRLEACLTRIENVTTRFERRLITSIEQIPELLASELVTQTNEHEYDSVVLVRQTPITSHPASQPDSKNETPARTPIDARTPLRTPAETPPPTPPSTPTRHQSPVRPSLTARPTEKSTEFGRPPLVAMVESSSNTGGLHRLNKHFLAQPRRNLRPITLNTRQMGATGPVLTQFMKSPSNQPRLRQIGLMRPTLSQKQELQFGMFPLKSVSSIGWAGRPVGLKSEAHHLKNHETSRMSTLPKSAETSSMSTLPKSAETSRMSTLPRSVEKTPNPPPWFNPLNPLESAPHSGLLRTQEVQGFFDRHNPLSALNPSSTERIGSGGIMIPDID